MPSFEQQIRYSSKIFMK